MRINSYSKLPTVLDYLDNDDNDNSIESILSSASDYRTASIKQRLGIPDTKDSAETAKNILTASVSAAETLDRLLSTDDNSIFKKAGNDTSDTALTDAVTEVQSFVASYNTLVKNMSSQGGTVNITYLTELGKAYVDNEKELNDLGITRGSDGLLSVDTDKLKAADLNSLKTAFNGKDSYAESVNGILESIHKVTSKTSAMSGVYSSNYGSNAETEDITSMLLDSIFNSKA